MRLLASLCGLLTACGSGRDFSSRPGPTGDDSLPSGAARAERTQILGRGDGIQRLEGGRAQAILDVVPSRYRADDGVWRPASDDLVRGEDGAWANRTHLLRSYLPAVATGAIAVERGGTGLAFVPRGMAWCDAGGACSSRVVPASVEGEPDSRRSGRIVYPQVYPDVDEEFRVSAIGLKHDLVLRAPPAGPEAGYVSFVWELRLGRGLVPMVRGRPVEGEATTQGVIEVRDASGMVRMAIAAPRIAAAPGEAPHDGERTMGTYRIAARRGSYEIELRAPMAWLLEAGRGYPVRLDPTVMAQPEDDGHTGSVSFDGLSSYDRDPGRITSGALALINPSWTDVAGFARFITTPAACLASIDQVELLVWLDNHDNFDDPALPLGVEIHASDADPVVASDQQLFDAIANGAIYAADTIPRTASPSGDSSFCVGSYAYREYDLGTQAAADLFTGLRAGWFAIGFRSEIGADSDFDHVDYIGYPENVDGACGFEDFPGTRISLRVTGTAKAAPMASAGGPYGAACGVTDASVQLDGSASSAGGAPLSYEWTTDCPGGALDDPFSPTPMLTVALGGACEMACGVTLTVSDGCGVSTATNTVAIGDTDSPTVAAGPLDGACLWSPNHKYVCTTDLGGFAQAEDECSSVALTVMACASDQPDEAPDPSAPGDNGDGHTTGDCVIAPDGRGFCVRSERLGTSQAGRHYGLAFLADDGCSPATPFSTSFFVPHDQAPHEDCVNGKDSPYLEVRQDLPWSAP